MKAARVSAVEAAISGISGRWSVDLVRGRLPAGWRLVHGPAALPDFAGGIVVTAGADGPMPGDHAGARVAVSAERLAAAERTGLVEGLVGELALALTSACAAKTAR